MHASLAEHRRLHDATPLARLNKPGGVLPSCRRGVRKPRTCRHAPAHQCHERTRLVASCCISRYGSRWPYAQVARLPAEDWSQCGLNTIGALTILLYTTCEFKFSIFSIRELTFLYDLALIQCRLSPACQCDERTLLVTSCRISRYGSR